MARRDRAHRRRQGAQAAARRADAKSRSAKLAGLVAAIAEASPYLWDLIRAEPDRFLGILEAEPEGHFAAVIADGDARRASPRRTRPR